MTIRESLDFTYDGVSSATMGLYNVNVSSGMQEEPFSNGREILEQTVRGRTVPYFQEIREKPLEFEVEFAFIDSWDNTSIRKIGQWLLKSYYKPLYFSDNPDRIFWAVVVDSPTLVHNSLKQGYVKLKFRCSDAYAYSPIYASPLYDYSSNPVAGTTLTFTNNGDLSLYPEIWITNITANQTVSIFNQSNGNIEFKFVSLNANETVYIDNFNQFITTDVVGQYRYSNFNNNWLELLVGVNNLLVKGNCKLQFRYSYRLMQG